MDTANTERRSHRHLLSAYCPLSKWAICATLALAANPGDHRVGGHPVSIHLRPSGQRIEPCSTADNARRLSLSSRQSGVSVSSSIERCGASANQMGRLWLYTGDHRESGVLAASLLGSLIAATRLALYTFCISRQPA